MDKVENVGLSMDEEDRFHDEGAAAFRADFQNGTETDNPYGPDVLGSDIWDVAYLDEKLRVIGDDFEVLGERRAVRFSIPDENGEVTASMTEGSTHGSSGEQ